MAAKNSIKDYVENGIYHLYNRGVNKSEIFFDDQDRSVFCSYLKDYLLPKDIINLHAILDSKESSLREKDRALKLLKLKNFSEEIDLLCYTTLPNHFHLLIKQSLFDTIDRFINSFGARYSMYFNRKYRRVGPLFQGRYKAVLVDSEEQLLHLSRYIHLNPFVWLNKSPTIWQELTWPSSLPEFFGARTTKWVKPDLILNYFHKGNSTNNYEAFINDHFDSTFLAKIALDLNED